MNDIFNIYICCYLTQKQVDCLYKNKEKNENNIHIITNVFIIEDLWNEIEKFMKNKKVSAMNIYFISNVIDYHYHNNHNIENLLVSNRNNQKYSLEDFVKNMTCLNHDNLYVKINKLNYIYINNITKNNYLSIDKKIYKNYAKHIIPFSTHNHENAFVDDIILKLL